jgi:hypothetical protein
MLDSRAASLDLRKRPWVLFVEVAAPNKTPSKAAYFKMIALGQFKKVLPQMIENNLKNGIMSHPVDPRAKKIRGSPYLHVTAPYSMSRVVRPPKFARRSRFSSTCSHAHTTHSKCQRLFDIGQPMRPTVGLTSAVK